ncbi:hypothetical protein GS982_20095 [Rhodococcus hoagii]|nr:hypothetical protein [Prescottella equi]
MTIEVRLPLFVFVTVELLPVGAGFDVGAACVVEGFGAELCGAAVVLGFGALDGAAVALGFGALPVVAADDAPEDGFCVPTVPLDAFGAGADTLGAGAGFGAGAGRGATGAGAAAMIRADASAASSARLTFRPLVLQEVRFVPASSRDVHMRPAVAGVEAAVEQPRPGLALYLAPSRAHLRLRRPAQRRVIGGAHLPAAASQRNRASRTSGDSSAADGNVVLSVKCSFGRATSIDQPYSLSKFMAVTA